MRRLFSLAVLGVAAAGLILAMPSTSQAQGCDYGGYGSSYGGANLPGYGGYNGYYDRGYSPSYRGYSGYGGYPAPTYSQSYGRYYDRRPVIEHPTSSHWTPDRGLHTHGHSHVPHRRHYHTSPY